MPAPKNVLLIVVDQWRGLMLPKLGADYLKLPNIDRLCAEGVTFRNHFTQSVPCGPARASLLTGLYVMNHRAVQNTIPLSQRFTNLAHELRRGGYDPALPGDRIHTTLRLATRRPRRNTVTSSAKAITSRNLCVIMTMLQRPSCARSRSVPSTSSASCGVSTLVGSSRIRSWGRLTSARHTARDLRGSAWRVTIAERAHRPRRATEADTINRTVATAGTQ